MQYLNIYYMMTGMSKAGKSLALDLVLVMAFSGAILLTVKPASAQTPTPSLIPTLSVPEFTLKFVASFYNTTVTDPYTGVNSTKTVDNSYIQVSIKNQPFTCYSNANGNELSFYYSVRAKGHYEEKWGPVVQPENGSSFPYVFDPSGSDIYTIYFPQTTSEYTFVSISASNYPADGQVDFQVQANIGYVTTVLPENPVSGLQFIGETSVWTPTQTITIPSSTVPEFPTLILPLLLSVFSVVVIGGKRKFT